MAVASFEDLCRGVCELVGCEAPALERDERDNLAIRVAIQGIDVKLTHEPARSRTHAFVLAGFGPFPQDSEVDACKALLELNAELLRYAGACFSRDPVSGDAVLQYAYALDAGTAVDLYQRVGDLTSVVRAWQQRVTF
jgi:hypothetical protein